MRQLVNAGKKSPVVRQLAVSLTKGLVQKDWASEIIALHHFVRDRIRYVKDINGIETLHTPEIILHNAQGDCDDKTILLSSLLESLGHKTRLVAVGFRKNSFSHVYPEVLYKGHWISLETTEPVGIGWKPKGIVTSLILVN
jgi:transglutaminase-like putative cysteine protease